MLAGLGSGVDGARGNAEGAPTSPTASPARTGAGGQAYGVPMRQRHELLFPRFFLSWGWEEAKEIDSKEEESHSGGGMKMWVPLPRKAGTRRG